LALIMENIKLQHAKEGSDENELCPNQHEPRIFQIKKRFKEKYTEAQKMNQTNEKKRSNSSTSQLTLDDMFTKKEVKANAANLNFRSKRNYCTKTSQ
jgi:hypothetical protein